MLTLRITLPRGSCGRRGLLSWLRALTCCRRWQAALSFWIYTIVCFAFLGLKEVAVAMSDPFGDDDVDFDVERMLEGEEFTGRVRAAQGGVGMIQGGRWLGWRTVAPSVSLTRRSPSCFRPLAVSHSVPCRSAAAWQNSLALLQDDRWPDGQSLAPGLRNPITDPDAPYVERVKDLPPGWDFILNPSFEMPLSRRLSARFSTTGSGKGSRSSTRVSSFGSGKNKRSSDGSGMGSSKSLIDDKELLDEYDSKVQSVEAFRPRRSLACGEDDDENVPDAGSPVANGARRLSIDGVLKSRGRLSFEDAYVDDLVVPEGEDDPGLATGAKRPGFGGKALAGLARVRGLETGLGGAPEGAPDLSGFARGIGLGDAPESAAATVGSEEKSQAEGFFAKISQGLGEGVKPIARIGTLARGLGAFGNFGRPSSPSATDSGCANTHQMADVEASRRSCSPPNPRPESPRKAPSWELRSPLEASSLSLTLSLLAAGFWLPATAVRWGRVP